MGRGGVAWIGVRRGHRIPLPPQQLRARGTRATRRLPRKHGNLGRAHEGRAGRAGSAAAIRGARRAAAFERGFVAASVLRSTPGDGKSARGRAGGGVRCFARTPRHARHSRRPSAVPSGASNTGLFLPESAVAARDCRRGRAAQGVPADRASKHRLRGSCSDAPPWEEDSAAGRAGGLHRGGSCGGRGGGARPSEGRAA